MSISTRVLAGLTHRRFVLERAGNGWQINGAPFDPDLSYADVPNGAAEVWERRYSPRLWPITKTVGRSSGGSPATPRIPSVPNSFFPIADVNSNPANPIINTRAFGGDPVRRRADDGADPAANELLFLFDGHDADGLSR